MSIKSVAFGLALASALQAQPQNTYKRFSLFNQCGPMAATAVIVPVSIGEGSKMLADITAEPLETVVKARLEDARLYVPVHLLDRTTGPWAKAALYVLVAADYERPRIHVDLEFKRILFDASNDTAGYATTWSLGTTVDASENVNAQLHKELDVLVRTFILDYMRVNGKACAEAGLER